MQCAYVFGRRNIDRVDVSFPVLGFHDDLLKVRGWGGALLRSEERLRRETAPHRKWCRGVRALSVQSSSQKSAEADDSRAE